MERHIPLTYPSLLLLTVVALMDLVSFDALKDSMVAEKGAVRVPIQGAEAPELQ